MNDMINTYKKTLSDFDIKNQKYKSNNNILKEEVKFYFNQINLIEVKLKEIIKFKEEISSLQLEVSALRNKTSELEAENVGLKQSELVFKEENKVIDITNLKDIL